MFCSKKPTSYHKTLAHIAHLILAYRSPKAVARLAKAITDENADMYIHIDKKVSLAPFIKELRPHRHVHLITKRTEISWGAYSMVKATLDSLKEILSQNKNYDFVNLLSESDYPLTSANKFHHFLDQHTGKSFMEMHFKDSPWWQEAQQKITKYHFTDYRFPGRYLTQKLVNNIFSKRKLPLNMVFTGRSQWMTLSLKHITYLLSFVDKNPSVIRFFKHTWGPDEFFFQTILYNSPFRNELINDNLRYIDWTEKKMSPKTLTVADFEALKTSGKHYARKFDETIDQAILDRIDALVELKK